MSSTTEDTFDSSATSSTADTQPSGLDYFQESFPLGGTGPATPNGNLILDSAGDVYGTTQAGGPDNRGTVFEAADQSTGGLQEPTALTTFSNYKGTGALSPGNLVMDSSGNLLGTTATGGTTKRSDGTIFELTKTSTGYSSTPTVITSFKEGTGAGPENLTTDAAGNLYGTTETGRGGLGGGTVFEVAKTAKGYGANERILASFRGKEHITSNLLVTQNGIYGAVSGGKAGVGEVFEFQATRGGTYRHTPTIINRGISVQNLAADGSGNVFAVSSSGGTDNQGAVYELGAKGAATDLLNFDGAFGTDPTGITTDSAGNIYGTTRSGGANGIGTVYAIAKTSSGYVAQSPISFTGATGSFPGANPIGSPTVSGDFLYGTTTGGSSSGELYGIRTSNLGTSDATPAATSSTSATPAVVRAAVVRQAANAPCFASGTRIRTTTGETLVEELRVGDLVVTASGAARPVTWLGHGVVDCRRHPHPLSVKPIRIAAHAFAPNRPSRDLYVSPGHSICVEGLSGEVLIPACALVNDTTVTQVEAERITYWHVELESHDILLADNQPAESYLEMDNRAFFVEADVVALAASPDAAPVRTHADFCRPFHDGGPVVEAVRARQATRAAAMEEPGAPGEDFRQAS